MIFIIFVKKTMYNIIFTYEGVVDEINIGDYIQSLAAKQFLKENIIYFQRDNLKNYNLGPAKAIMNGWFTHCPQNWPPSDQITPLFVSFHINHTYYQQMTSDDSIRYFKKFEPIGCRDQATADLLESKGIKTYFSSCLTTTLGMTYKSEKKTDNIYIVDPVHFVPEFEHKKGRWKFIFYYLMYMKGINEYIRKIRKDNVYTLKLKKKYWKRYASIIRSYIILRKLLRKEDLKNARIISQMHFEDEYPNNEERFRRAEQLIKMYSEAKAVITSRIHCALPCTGLETPVIMLRNNDDESASSCRFKNLENMFNCIEFRKNSITRSGYRLPLNLNEIKNPTDYRQYASALIDKCKEFTKETGN